MGAKTHIALRLLPRGAAFLLRGIGSPGIYGVNVAIQEEVQNQYETHWRLFPLKLEPGARH